MRLRVRSRGAPLAEAQVVYAHCCAWRTLGPYRETIRAASVDLQEVRTPRGGSVRDCRVRVHLYSGEELVAHDASPQTGRAVAGACLRVASLLAARAPRRSPSRAQPALAAGGAP